MQVPENAKAHLALLLANMIYGANYTIARIPLQGHIASSGFILLRVSGAAMLFVLTGLYVGKTKIEIRDHLRLFLCALCGVAFNQLLFFKGLSMTTPINAAIMMLVSPLVVTALTYFGGADKISVRSLFGVFLGLGGALFLVTKGFAGIPFQSGSNAGDALVFANAALWGVYLVLVRPMIKKYPTVPVMQWVFIYGTLAVLPFGLSDVQHIQWGVLPQDVLLSVIYVVVATTFLAYLLNNYALSSISPSGVSIYIYLQPLLASVFAILWGSDHWSFDKFISLGLVFVGVYLVTFPKQKT